MTTLDQISVPRQEQPCQVNFLLSLLVGDASACGFSVTGVCIMEKSKVHNSSDHRFRHDLLAFVDSSHSFSLWSVSSKSVPL